MISNKRGFTLIEILIALALGGIVMAFVFSAYQTQQKSSVIQEQVVEIQSNVRAGMDMMTREIRMAGYDPDDTDLYTITTAIATIFAFDADLNEDGGGPGAGESFQFELYDSDGDTFDDALRSTAGGVAIAEGIEQIEFNYILADGTETTAPGAGDYANIRSVEISLLARTSREDPKFTNNQTYTTAAGNLWPVNDNYRRRLVIKRVSCRNMGL